MLSSLKQMSSAEKELVTWNGWHYTIDSPRREIKVQVLSVRQTGLLRVSQCKARKLCSLQNQPSEGNRTRNPTRDNTSLEI